MIFLHTNVYFTVLPGAQFSKKIFQQTYKKLMKKSDLRKLRMSMWLSKNLTKISWKT